MTATPGALLRIKDDAEMARLIKGSDGPVIVKVGAKWCGPCTRITPALEALAKEHPHICFVDVDVDEAPEIAERFEPSGLPSFYLVRANECVKDFVGADMTLLHKMVQAATPVRTSSGSPTEC